MADRRWPSTTAGPCPARRSAWTWRPVASRGRAAREREDDMARNGTKYNPSPMATKKIRILTAKVGLDGHDRGIKVISRALRDAGVEVIYTGLHQTPGMVVEPAIQEDVDGIGISLLSGAHMTLFPEVLRLLRERGAGDIVVFGGGIVPDSDVATLAKMGGDKVVTP